MRYRNLKGVIVMHQIAKRSLALLMALIMCIGLLPALQFNADAASWEYNWGKRGVIADELSDRAESFYANHNTSYDELAAYTGGTGTSDAPNSALYDALQELMSEAQTYVTSYAATRDMFPYTDCQEGNGVVTDFYSGEVLGTAWDADFWSREHTWPNSKGDASGDGENDIMMLRPAHRNDNSARGNKAYGESIGFYDPNENSGGALNLRGDVSRIMLYVYVRWGNTGSMWGSDGVIESLDVLLKWMEEDPVDTWELGRNDSVESITGTRNVFVDYPELAFLLFGEDVPADYPFVAHFHSLVEGQPSAVQLQGNVAHLGPSQHQHGQIRTPAGEASAYIAGGDALRGRKAAAAACPFGHQRQKIIQNTTHHQQRHHQIPGIQIGQRPGCVLKEIPGQGNRQDQGLPVHQRGLAGKMDGRPGEGAIEQIFHILLMIAAFQHRLGCDLRREDDGGFPSFDGIAEAIQQGQGHQAILFAPDKGRRQLIVEGKGIIPRAGHRQRQQQLAIFLLGLYLCTADLDLGGLRRQGIPHRFILLQMQPKGNRHPAAAIAAEFGFILHFGGGCHRRHRDTDRQRKEPYP